MNKVLHSLFFLLFPVFTTLWKVAPLSQVAFFSFSSVTPPPNHHITALFPYFPDYNINFLHRNLFNTATPFCFSVFKRCLTCRPSTPSPTLLTAGGFLLTPSRVHPGNPQCFLSLQSRRNHKTFLPSCRNFRVLLAEITPVMFEEVPPDRPPLLSLPPQRTLPLKAQFHSHPSNPTPPFFDLPLSLQLLPASRPPFDLKIDFSPPQVFLIVIPWHETFESRTF